MATFVDIKGRQPYIKQDTTRSWVESVGRKDGLVRPSLVLRFATDANHVRNAYRTLYNPVPRDHCATKAVMNNCLPGQHIQGVLNWSTSEQSGEMTSTATFEALNCLQLSTTTTTVTNPNPLRTVTNDGINNQAHHADTIAGTWAQDSLFAVERVTGPGGRDSRGNINIEYVKDVYGYYFREANVQYRLFQDQIFEVDDATLFPDASIPMDDDNDVAYDMSWAQSPTGSGAYYILVGNEVMRVSQVDKVTHTFHVAAGGRAINGVIQSHVTGEKVTLLGFGKSTGEFCAMGYLSVDDFHPESAILRPGTCLASYEGYGDIQGPLTHEFNPNSNYTFTGYWFIDSVEPSLGADGVPRVSVSLRGTGAIFEDQKIDLDTIQRMKNQFGQWTVKGKTLFSAAGANRSIPGDWVDYSSWDPTDQYSYPLQIFIEYAQHYAFYQHMQDTQNGLTCIQCHAELSDYLKTHAAETARDRPVGRHIYKESIRVIRENAGPIKTYVRLMATMAMAAWDHPAYGTELSQKFTKIPNQLFDNARNIFTGLCYDGQLDFSLESADPSFDFSTPGYDDKKVISGRKKLTCPFQSSYDNAPFAQPMLDLAEINGANFWITREGYPVFKPQGWNFRPETSGYRHLNSDSTPNKTGPRFPENPHLMTGINGEWFLSYGASISSYSSSIAKNQIITQTWVTASSAFDLDNSGNGFTITAAGTGYDDTGNLIWYSPLGGNKQGLGLTGGVQQTDTMTMDNQYLGLNWDTNPAGWGMVENEDGVDVTMNAKPPLYDGSIRLSTSTKGVSNATKRIQQTCNFFLVRGYMNPIILNGLTHFTLDISGTYDEVTKLAVENLQGILAHGTAGTGGIAGASISGGNFIYHSSPDPLGEYGRCTYLAVRDYLDQNAYFIKTDIWWYVRNGLTWDQYIASIVGLPIPFTKGNAPKPHSTTQAYSTPLYVIDDIALQKEVATWYKTFAQTAINVGNRAVNRSIDQAVQRSVQVSLADPRIQPGDTIFCEIPGTLTAMSQDGSMQPPFNNGIWVTTVQRNMDLEAGTYTATYSGTRQQGIFGRGVTEVVNPKYDFITS